jgi:hypothetical protein
MEIAGTGAPGDRRGVGTGSKIVYINLTPIDVDVESALVQPASVPAR